MHRALKPRKTKVDAIACFGQQSAAILGDDNPDPEDIGVEFGGDQGGHGKDPAIL
jgi:hypothetical protein